MILLTTKGRFLFNLDFLVPAVLEKGAKNGKNRCFIKTHVECLFFFRLFFYCVTYLIKGKQMYWQILCVLDCFQVIGGQSWALPPKNQLFNFLVRFRFFNWFHHISSCLPFSIRFHVSLMVFEV